MVDNSLVDSYDVTKDADGSWSWSVKDADGNVLDSASGYKDEEEATSGLRGHYIQFRPPQEELESRLQPTDKDGQRIDA